MTDVNSLFAEKIHFPDNMHTHAHTFGHLILPLHGTLHLHTTRQAIAQDSQHILFLPGDCEHSYYSRETNEFLVFYIPDYMISAHFFAEVKFFELDEKWRALRFLMLNECQNKKTHANAISQLLHYSFQLIQANYEYPSIRYLQENYHRNISLEKLALLEHYHVCYYSTWFQKKMGCTVQMYLQKMRIEEAKKLLRDTNYTMLDIAQQVGYEQQASLTRIFKKHEGITPNLYRNMLKQVKSS